MPCYCSKNKTVRRWSLVEDFWIHAMLDLFCKKKVALSVFTADTVLYRRGGWYIPGWHANTLIHLMMTNCSYRSLVHYKLLPCNIKCKWKQPPQRSWKPQSHFYLALRETRKRKKWPYIWKLVLFVGVKVITCSSASSTIQVQMDLPVEDAAPQVWGCWGVCGLSLRLGQQEMGLLPCRSLVVVEDLGH